MSTIEELLQNEAVKKQSQINTVKWSIKVLEKRRDELLEILSGNVFDGVSQQELNKVVAAIRKGEEVLRDPKYQP